MVSRKGSRHGRSDAPIHVLWINAGLSCDGDSVALTAATQPSIEEIALGALPGSAEDRGPLAADRLRVRPDGGADDFLEWFRKADRGELEPFVLVVEGSIPNEKIKDEGYWAAFGNDPDDRPADHDQRVARPAGARRRWPSSPSAPARPTAASTRWRATRPARWACPTTSGWDWKSQGRASRSSACPGCPIQPDNLVGDAALPALPGHRPGADDPARRRSCGRPWLFGKTVHEGCDRAGYYEQGDFADRVRLAQVHRQARLLGPGGQVQRAQARLDERHRRLPQRRRHLHRLHDARLPRQVHAVHGRAARRQALDDARSGCTASAIRALRAITNADARQGAEVAPAAARSSPPATSPRLVTRPDR